MRLAPTLLASLGVLLLGRSAFAHDYPYTLAEDKAVEAIGKMLEAAPALDAATLDAVAGAGQALSAEALTHYDDCKLYGQLDTAGRGRLGRALEALRYLRALAGKASSASEVAVLLSSPNPDDINAASLLLSHLPTDDSFVSVLSVLSTDSRPEIRIQACILAKVGFLFGGDKDKLISFAERALLDQDPDVVAAFGEFHHPYDFHSTRLIDLCVRLLDDPRRRTLRESGLLAGPAEPISERILLGLRADFKVWRDTFTETNDTLPKNFSAEQFKTWWKEARSKWVFGADRTDLVLAFDGMAILDPKEPTRIEGKQGERWLTLKEFKEGVFQGTPTVSLQVAVSMDKAGEDLLMIGGRKLHPLGHVGLYWGSTGILECLARTGPDGKIALRLTLWEPKH